MLMTIGIFVHKRIAFCGNFLRTEIIKFVHVCYFFPIF